MSDPLAEIVTLLQPALDTAKLVSAAGPWRVRREDAGSPFYMLVLEGSCRFAADGQAPLILQAGDFVLTPATWGKTSSSPDTALPDTHQTRPVRIGEGEFRLGRIDGPAEARMLIGHCHFAAPDARLLVSLLPALILVRNQTRLTTLVQLVRDESLADRPARDVVLSRLLEVLMIEALRSGAEIGGAPGLMQGLADARLAAVLRALHDDPAHGWTVQELARLAALSRSAFFARFSRTVGLAPMEYLLAWRMAVGKSLLRRRESVASVAGQVGYGSASAFSVAFTRHVGRSPTDFIRQEGEATVR